LRSLALPTENVGGRPKSAFVETVEHWMMRQHGMHEPRLLATE
jgi:hypothetical protein